MREASASVSAKRRSVSEDLHTRIRRLGTAAPVSVSIQRNKETDRRQLEVVVNTASFSSFRNAAPFVLILDLRRLVFWMSMLLLCASAGAFSVAPNRWVGRGRAQTVQAVVAPWHGAGARLDRRPAAPSVEDAAIEGAMRVRDAAASFGPVQAAAASEWLEAAFAGDAGGASLLEQQLDLFDECSLGEPGDELRCKAFSESLSTMCSAELERRATVAAAERDAELDVAAARPAPISLSARFDRFCGHRSDARAVAAGRVRVAAARVRRASAGFGQEQRESVDEWLARAAAGQADMTDGGAELLQRKVPLFECFLAEEGAPSKCEELAEAVEALQGKLSLDPNSTSLSQLLENSSELFESDVLLEVSGQIGNAASAGFGADAFDVATFAGQLLSLLSNGEFSAEKLKAELCADKLKGYFARACVSTLLHKAVGTASIVLASSGVHH